MSATPNRRTDTTREIGQSATRGARQTIHEALKAIRQMFAETLRGTRPTQENALTPEKTPDRHQTRGRSR